DGSRLYVNQRLPWPSKILVYDTANTQQPTEIIVPNDSDQIALSRSGSRLYVTHTWPASVSVVDAVNQTMITNVPAGNEAVAVTGNEKFVYVGGATTVSVLESGVNQVTQTITGLTGRVTGLAFTPDDAYAYAANINGDSVTVIKVA